MLKISNIPRNNFELVFKYLFWFFFAYVCAYTLTVIKINPDGWAYIEGAKNILNHKLYITNANSHEIRPSFPPGFSLYLIPFIKFIGYNIWSFKIASLVSYVACTFLILKTNKNWMVRVLILLSLSFIFQSILSETLLVTLTLSYFYIQKIKNKYQRFFLSFIIFLIMLNVKHSSLLIIPLILIIGVYINREDKFSNTLKELKKITDKLITPVSLFIAAYLLYKLVDYMIFGSYNHHKLGFWNGKISFFEYINEFIFYFNKQFFFIVLKAFNFKVGLLGALTILSFVLYLFKKNKIIGAVYVFTIFLNILIFSTIRIADPLGGRFLFWLMLPLIVTENLKISKFKSYLVLFIFINVMILQIANDFKGLKSFRGYSIDISKMYLTIHTKFMDTEIFECDEPYEPIIILDHESKTRYISSPCYKWLID